MCHYGCRCHVCSDSDNIVRDIHCDDCWDNQFTEELEKIIAASNRIQQQRERRAKQEGR